MGSERQTREGVFEIRERVWGNGHAFGVREAEDERDKRASVL
jgi:hypothetical protein